MSARRGFLRIWVVFSIIWAGTFGLLAISAYQTRPESPPELYNQPCDDPAGKEPWCFLARVYAERIAARELPGIYAGAAVAGPLSTLALGMAAFWIIAGFKRN
jgi:hypothetical protein